MGFRVSGFRLWVEKGLRVWGSGLRVKGRGYRGFRVWGVGFTIRIQGLGFTSIELFILSVPAVGLILTLEVQGCEFQDLGLGFRVWFRV